MWTEILLFKKISTHLLSNRIKDLVIDAVIKKNKEEEEEDEEESPRRRDKKEKINEKKKNKAGYTATDVACGWAGALRVGRGRI